MDQDELHDGGGVFQAVGVRCVLEIVADELAPARGGAGKRGRQRIFTRAPAAAQRGGQRGLDQPTSGEHAGSQPCQTGSGEDAVHHLAVHVGEAHVAAAEAVGQPLVVDAQQVQHRGVQVVDVDLVLHRPEAVVVGGAVDLAAAHAAARQPHGEAVGVVVAAGRSCPARWGCGRTRRPRPPACGPAARAT